MMTNKRIEYEPLKAVLQSLEPNLRIQLALRIPSLRTVEKLIPMKIANFASGDHKIVINDTTYQVGIYRQYHNPAETPRHHRKNNERGGFERDLDQWGFQTNPYENPLAEGDIDLRPTRGAWIAGNERMERVYIERVVIQQEALRRLAERNGEALEPDFVIPELRNFPNSERIISRNEQRIQGATERTVERLQDYISTLFCRILPYHYRRHNIMPPYIPFIQLTISGPKGKSIERVEYPKRLYEAMKYLNAMFFGERRHPIQAKELSFVRNSFPHRLPKDLKIKTKQIQSYALKFDRLNNLLVPDSYPLDMLTIESRAEDSNDFEQEVVGSARKLVIISDCDEEISWIPLVQNMKNPCTILKYQTERHVPRHYIDLIENWFGSDRTKGTNLSIGFRQLETVMNLLASFKSHFEVIKMSERSLTLAMNNGSRLRISCEQAEVDLEETRNDAEFSHVDEEKKSNWILKLIVL